MPRIIANDRLVAGNILVFLTKEIETGPCFDHLDWQLKRYEAVQVYFSLWEGPLNILLLRISTFLEFSECPPTSANTEPSEGLKIRVCQ